MASPATVYARALLEAAKDAGENKKISEDLRSLATLIDSSNDLRTLLNNASLDRNARDAILKEILMTIGASKLVYKLLYMLSERSRLMLLPELVRDYSRLLDLESGILAGELSSAIELSSDEVERLASAIAKRAGRKIHFEQKVDADLLGGFVARVGGKTYDASLRTQLNRLRDELI